VQRRAINGALLRSGGMHHVNRDSINFEFLLEQLADERRAVGRLGGARNLNQAPSAKGKKKKYNNQHTIF
jgi:hypothetical protein